MEQIRRDGQAWLGIPTGITGGGLALTRLTALRGSPGWVVGPDGVREWKVDGFSEQDGRVYLYGPWLEGRSLEELLGRPLEELLPLFERLVRALLALQAHSVPLFDLQTDAAVFLEDGGVLFLPPEMMRRVTDSRPAEYRSRVYHELNHNGLRGEQRISFALGVLLYRAAAGIFPFHGEREEEIQDRMRRLDILPPSLAVPEIRTEFSGFIMRALGREAHWRASARPEVSRLRDGPPPGLEEWRDALSGWIRDGVYRPVDTGERRILEQAAEEKRKRGGRAFRRRVFWRKHWKTAAIAAAAVLVVAWLAASMARNLLEPRATRGFPPERVVETYYLSQNRLDHMTMEDCLARGVARGDINEVMHLYVMSRVTMGYEGRSGVVSADEWVEAGRPALEAPLTVFGVTGLSIRPLAGPPEPVFEAAYEKWGPASAPSGGEGPPDGPRIAGFRVLDRLILRQDRGDWVIVQLDRLETAPLPATGLQPAADPPAEDRPPDR